MSLIRPAGKNDIPAMSDIWMTSFGDSADFVALFMEKRLPSATALVLEEDGAVVSQLFLLPGEMSVSGEKIPSFYLYAAATSPQGRSKGYMARLMDAAKRCAVQSGRRCIALVPGEAGLYGYYARFGFYEAFGYRLLRLSRAELSAAADGEARERPMTAAEMASARDGRLAGQDAFLWDEQAVSFAAGQHVFAGGRVLCADGAWALASSGDGVVSVGELCADKTSFGAVARVLLDATRESVFEIKVPVRAPFVGGTPLKGGMLFDAGGGDTPKIRDAYMGLAME